MALIDYLDTQERMLDALREKGRKKDWLYQNLLKPTEDEADLDSLLTELTDNGKIHNQYGYLHLVTSESEARRTNRRQQPTPIANPWAWYAWLPESLDFRKEIRQRFTAEDAKVFRALAAIITAERPPRLGTRISGDITEKEGRYIVKVNEALNAYIDRMKNG